MSKSTKTKAAKAATAKAAKAATTKQQFKVTVGNGALSLSENVFSDRKLAEKLFFERMDEKRISRDDYRTNDDKSLTSGKAEGEWVVTLTQVTAIEKTPEQPTEETAAPAKVKATAPATKQFQVTSTNGSVNTRNIMPTWDAAKKLFFERIAEKGIAKDVCDVNDAQQYATTPKGEWVVNVTPVVSE